MFLMFAMGDNNDSHVVAQPFHAATATGSVVENSRGAQIWHEGTGLGIM